MGPIGCPKTSVQDYQSTLRKAPEEPRSRLHLCGGLKPHINNTCLISSSPKNNGYLCLPIVCLQPLTFHTPANQHNFPPTRSYSNCNSCFSSLTTNSYGLDVSTFSVETNQDFEGRCCLRLHGLTLRTSCLHVRVELPARL